jgi:hypothetical protein
LSRLTLQIDFGSKRWKFLQSFEKIVKRDCYNVRFVRVVFVNLPESSANLGLVQDLAQSMHIRKRVKFTCREEYVLASADVHGDQGFTEAQATELETALDGLITFDAGETVS